jgi:hypothetical protein
MIKIRSILWGTIIIAWVLVRVFRTMGGGANDLNLFGRLVGFIFFFGLPIGIIFEVVHWIKKRRR